MYEQFQSWVQRNLNRELEQGEGMQFDDVNIEKGDKRQVTPILIELWESEKETQRALLAHDELVKKMPRAQA